MAKTPPSVAEPAAERPLGPLPAGTVVPDPELDLLLKWPDQQRGYRTGLTLHDGDIRFV